MAKLSVEEPDALMCARPDLWEPWAGNCPGPPGPPQDTVGYVGLRWSELRASARTASRHLEFRDEFSRMGAAKYSDPGLKSERKPRIERITALGTLLGTLWYREFDFPTIHIIDFFYIRSCAFVLRSENQRPSP
jgi:hypothetical protein